MQEVRYQFDAAGRQSAESGPPTPDEVARRLVQTLGDVPGVTVADLAVLVAHEAHCTIEVARRAVAAAMAALRPQP